MKRIRSILPLILALITVASVLHAAAFPDLIVVPGAPLSDACDDGTGDFQSCLNWAEDDGIGNILHVTGGTYNVTSTYTYSPATTENFPLMIQNLDQNIPILDGATTTTCLWLNPELVTAPNANADVVVTGLLLQNCAQGMDIRADESDVTVDTNDFVDNVANDEDGGGLYSVNVSGTTLVNGNNFQGNGTVFGNGGGAYIESSSGPVSLLNNIFTGNFADNDDGYSGGGALITVYSGPVVVDSNLLTGNTSGADGGGMVLESNDGGPLTVVNNILAGNTNGFTSGGTNLGGGLFVQMFEPAGFAITNNTLFGNTSQEGPGGMVVGQGGQTPGGGGLAVLIGNGIIADIYNNIIFGNSSVNGADIYTDEDPFDLGGGTVNLFNNDFSGFFSQALNGGGAGTVNQGNNIDENPLFEDSANDDFNLTEDSPCIDRGDPNAPDMPAEDYDDKPRPAGVDPDMGALEFQPPTPSPSASPTPPIPPASGNLEGSGCSFQLGGVSPGSFLPWIAVALLGLFARRRSH